MRIFEVLFAEGFQSIRFDGEPVDNLKYMAFNGRSWTGDWRPPAARIVDPDLPRPDIWRIHGVAGMAVTDAEGIGLGFALETSGQLLKFTCGDMQFQAHNIIECVDVLDRENSEWTAGSLPTRYAFRPGRIRSSLFKIPLTAAGQILCMEWTDDPEKEFKAGVEENNLKGVKFNLLWEGSSREAARPFRDIGPTGRGKTEAAERRAPQIKPHDSPVCGKAKFPEDLATLFYRVASKGDGVGPNRGWLKVNLHRLCCEKCGIARPQETALEPIPVHSGNFDLPLDFVYPLAYPVMRDDFFAALGPEGQNCLALGILVDEAGQTIPNFRTAPPRHAVVIRGDKESDNFDVCDACGRHHYFPRPDGRGYIVRSTFFEGAAILRGQGCICVNGSVYQRLISAGLADQLRIAELPVRERPEDGYFWDIRAYEAK